ncbi:chlorophyll(ide) b reductase NOL, chloroplastic isoform X2 [Nymphaea colorata]|uniref:chlorophyll(ide) b reductase NOL, chloroplastic isoform X2 n=1 Tax=Nymphaea colorata TaxID=210225 RepID=UPI00129E6359|nr:chlorophyll(ide) b reductase NOL, chloroplastic isoform X2 [Nymphaea colorata]
MASLHLPTLSPFVSPPNFKPDRLQLVSVLPNPSINRHLRGCSGFFPVENRPKIEELGSRRNVRAESGTREPMVPPYNVLITGSSKGIGYALAKEFLKAGDNIIICSRSEERVESAVRNLREEFGQHVWINNAGSNAYSYKPLTETSDEDLMEVVTTNTLGLMLCCREAIKMMASQPRGGHVFNIDGAGSDGRPTPRFAAYGATKRSVVHLTKSLQAELRMHEINNVMVHNLSPGMVTTDLLMSGALTKQAKFFINVLAEPADVVAEYLVPCIRAVPLNGSTRPTYIRFLTGLKAYSQIFSRIAFGARRNRYMLED